MPDGEYALGSLGIVKRGGAVYLADRPEILAGSALTMDRALVNLLQIGLPLAEAVRRISAIPAAYLGLDDAGRLETGARADIVVLDGEHAIAEVFVEGERVAPD